MSHSREFLRGAKWAFNEASEPLAASKMSALLAQAEARESAKPDGWHAWPPPDDLDHVIAYRPDAGVFPAECAIVYEGNGERDWFTHGGRESLHGDRPTRWRRYPTYPSREAAPDAAAVIKQCKAEIRTRDGKLACVEVRRPDTHGGMCCTWKMKDFDIQAEMEGCEVGEEIVLRYAELTDAEFEALGDFDGW